MLLPSMRWGSMVLRMEMMLTILMVCDKMSPIYFGVFLLLYGVWHIQLLYILLCLYAHAWEHLVPPGGYLFSSNAITLNDLFTCIYLVEYSFLFLKVWLSVSSSLIVQ